MSLMKYQNLFQMVSSLAPISEDEWDIFEEGFEEAPFKKGDVLEGPGDQPSYIYFVLEGVLRIYYVDSNGREFTKVFRGNGGLIAHYAELLQTMEAKAFIQAVSEGKIIKFKYELFSKMMEKFPSWQILGRKVAEDNYCEKERREYMLMQFSTQEKYDEFVRLYSGLKDLIPQYQVASYMGITPEALNRLLKKK